MSVDIVLCMPVSWGLPPVVEAAKQHCSKCRSEVWVAPSSEKVLARAESAAIVCLDCVNQLRGEFELEPVTPEQIAEIRRHFAEQN
jgi:hypothetical protein